MPRIAVTVLAVVLTGATAYAQSLPAPTSTPFGSDTVGSTFAAPQVDRLPTFASLFRDLGDDFRRLPSRESAVLLGVGGALSLAVRHEDANVTRRAAASQALDTAFEPGAVLGGGLVQFGAAFATFTLGRVQNSVRVSALGADLVRAQIVDAALTQGLKVAVGRERPDGGRYSFPSGHASSTFATATVLQRHFGWKVGLPAYGLAAYVAGSRLQENKHFMSDVIFGAAVGVVSGRAVSLGHGKTRFAMAPFAAAGGGGVGFTLLPSQ
jgi:membrane-associated phospholipid phosphatase